MTRKLTTNETDAVLLLTLVGLNLFNMLCWGFEVLAQGGGRGLM